MANILKVISITDVKIGYKNAAGTAIVYVDVPFANRFTQTQNPTELTFEGDNTSEKIFMSTELSGEISFDKLSQDVLEKIYGKRLYAGDGVGSTVMGNQGSGYTSAPGVTFSASPTTGGTATGVAVLGTGADAAKVVRVDVTSSGFGYVSPPTIAFSGGGGTGAAYTAVLGTLPSGTARRLYFGENDEFTPADVEIVVTSVGKDENGVTEEVTQTIPKATIGPYRPGDLGNKAKQVQAISWTAKKTTTDIIGKYLPGVPADGSTYFVDYRVA